jgi:hypothetical protein
MHISTIQSCASDSYAYSILVRSLAVATDEIQFHSVRQTSLAVATVLNARRGDFFFVSIFDFTQIPFCFDPPVGSDE